MLLILLSRGSQKFVELLLLIFAIMMVSYGLSGEQKRCYETDFVQTCNDVNVEYINSIYVE